MRIENVIGVVFTIYSNIFITSLVPEKYFNSIDISSIACLIVFYTGIGVISAYIGYAVRFIYSFKLFRMTILI
jgi:hypothetical protein